MITQKSLKEILFYDGMTGDFTWLTTMSYRAKKGQKAGYANKGYIFIGIRGRTYPAHRLAWFYVHGVWPNQIDHINHIKNDNHLINLRDVTTRENHKNKPVRSDNVSGVCGVCWDGNREKWYVQITTNDRRKAIGRFGDKFEAICARMSANNKYGYHANHGR